MIEPDTPSITPTVRPVGSPLELLVLGLFAVVGGLLSGILSYHLFFDIWMIIFCPLIVGCIVGYPYAWTIRFFKVRSTKNVNIAAVMTSVVLYLTSFYLFFREMAELADLEDLSFWSFMQINASEGFTIGEYGGTGIPVSGLFAWLAWLVDLGITAAVIAALGREITNQAFCEQCNNWHQSAILLGGVAPEHIEDFKRLILQAEYQHASALIQPEYRGPERLDVYLSRCKNSAHDLVLRVDQVESANKRTKTKELWRAAIVPEHAQYFLPN